MERSAIASWARRALTIILTAAGLALAAVTLIPAALGFDRYVITGDSMSGTYDRGSLLFAVPVPVADLAVDDVITYQPPAGAGPEGLVTHRISSIEEMSDGTRILRTAGDANQAPDPWRFELDQPNQARASFSIPYVGYALGLLSVKEARIAVIGIPALLIAVALVAKLWRDTGAEARRLQAALEARMAADQR